MVANGADGDTLAQFESVLGGGTSLSQLNGVCTKLIDEYTHLGGSTVCSIANSIWKDPDGEISDEFVGKCQGIFDAQVFEADLSDQSIVKNLNSWVSEHTKKMIPTIIHEPFSGDTAALLVNALYLKNQWASQFSPNATREKNFTHLGNTVERMDFLVNGAYTLPYLQGDGVQGVVLPYDDGRLGFFALLPDEDLNSWLSTLEGDDLSNLISQREDTYFINLSLPKFEQEWSGDLVEVLAGLGLDTAFDPDKADFSQLGSSSDGYYISQVIHATKIEVNEKGTKAAAVTVGDATTSSAIEEPPDGITLIFDRPFLYGIVDLETGIPLFLGTFE
jgi:serpin B